MSTFLEILLLSATITAAAPNMTLNQLSCEKMAAQAFHRALHDEDIVNYRAHYNASLNKCLYAETYMYTTPVGNNTWVYLSDLQLNRIYGGFTSRPTLAFFTAALKTRNATRKPSGTS